MLHTTVAVCFQTLKFSSVSESLIVSLSLDLFHCHTTSLTQTQTGSSPAPYHQPYTHNYTPMCICTVFLSVSLFVLCFKFKFSLPQTHPGQSILLVRELEDVEVTAPDQACFECELSMPLLKAPVWTLDGETLQNGPDVRLETQGSTHRLIFKKTSVDMGGIVRFTVGKAKTSAQLRVNN